MNTWLSVLRAFTFPKWLILGIAVLPGWLTMRHSWHIQGQWLIPDNVILICAIICGAGFAGRPRFPIWMLPALGILFSLLIVPEWLPPAFSIVGAFAFFGSWIFGHIALIAVLIWFHRQGHAAPKLAWGLIALIYLIGLAMPPILNVLFSNKAGWQGLFIIQTYKLTLIGPLLLVVALGLPLARRHGVAASLFVSGTAFVLWEFIIDFTYGLWHLPWGIVMVAIFALALLIVTPAWVLLARTTRGKTLGILLPPMVALISMSITDALIRTNPVLLDSFVYIYNIVPTVPKPWIGVGSRPPELLWPMLIQNGMESLLLYISLVLSVVLYRWYGDLDITTIELPEPIPTYESSTNHLLHPLAVEASSQ